MSRTTLQLIAQWQLLPLFAACPPLHLPLPSSQRPSSFLAPPGEAGARGSEGGGEAGEEYGERRFVEHGEDVLHEGEVSLHGGDSDEEAVAAGGLRAGAPQLSCTCRVGSVNGAQGWGGR